MVDRVNKRIVDDNYTLTAELHLNVGNPLELRPGCKRDGMGRNSAGFGFDFANYLRHFHDHLQCRFA